MVNDDFRPSLPASARRIRTHIEWNVETHMLRARGPTRAATRSFISPAASLVKGIAGTWPGAPPALVVKVIARISPGETPRSAIRYATRCVSTRVLPDPAPATIRSGPPE